MPKVSIITPVYCVEGDIKACIDSVLNQSFQDWELILVNDCSPDSSGAICEEYAQKDSRIRVIHHKVNGGAAKARRTGIDAALGEYIGFVDADDWIEPNMYEFLIEKIEEFSADILTCSYYINTKNNQTVNSNTGKVVRYNRMETLEALHVENSPISCMLWDKLYRREILADYNNNVEIVIGEDYSLLVKTIEQCQGVVCVDVPLYHYRQRSKSVCNAGYTNKRWLAIENYYFFRDYILKSYPELEDTLNAFCLVQEMAVLIAMTKNNCYDTKVIQKITHDIRSKYKSLFRINVCPLSFKMSALLVLLSPKLLLLVGKVRYSIQKNELF